MNDPMFISALRKDYPSELTRFISATMRKREIESELKQLNSDLRWLEHKLLDIMDRQDKKSMKLGRQTVFRKRELHMNKRGDVTVEQVNDLLTMLGYGEFCTQTYDHQGLRRELAKQEEIPEDLALVFDIDSADKLVLRNNL